MAFIAEKSRNMPASAIREMFAISEGISDLVSFAIGEPDFSPPPHILDAMIASIQRGETRYTPNVGIQPLRQAVSESYRARGLEYAPEEIIIGAGAISLLNIAATAILDLGDEVIIPDPGWANYKGLILQLGGVPVEVPVREEHNFTYTPEDLRAAITSRTKAILLNSPSNPTGSVASRAELEQIVEIVKEFDLYVIADEIYRELIYTEEAYTSIASLPDMKERCILVDGFSKTYAMTGLRLGYAAAPEPVIAVMRKLLENVLSSVNESVQWAGVAALQGSQKAVLQMKQQYKYRRDLAVSSLNAMPNVSCRTPSGAFYIFLNIKEMGLGSQEFALRLLKEERVVVVPGIGFGKSGEGYVRLSYATSDTLIREGMRRISKFLEHL